MDDFIGKLEFDTEAHPGARIIPLENGYAIVPDPDEMAAAEGWTSFDADGNLRDLESEGWFHVGALTE